MTHQKDENKTPKQSLTNHRSKVNGFGCLIINRNKVDKKGRCADESGHEQSANNHLSDPHFAAQPSVQTAAKEAVHWRGHRVHEDGRVEQRAALGVQFADDRKQNNNEDDRGHLIAGADQRRENG